MLVWPPRYAPVCAPLHVTLGVSLCCKTVRRHDKKMRKSRKYKGNVIVYTHMDTRRWCAAGPFRGQANLTRSWRNGVALCRTSSLPRAFKSSPWLVSRTRNATTGGPWERLCLSQVAASDPSSPTCVWRGAGRAGASLEETQSCLICTLSLYFLSVTLPTEHKSAEWACELRVRVEFHTVWSHDTGEVAAGAFAPWWGCSTEFLYRHTLLIRGSKWLQKTPPTARTHARTHAHSQGKWTYCNRLSSSTGST